MDGGRSVDLDDPAEHVPAIRGKKSRLFAARHVRLATDDLSEDDDVDTADAGMPPERLTYKEKMARARAMFASKSAGECAADGSLESPPGKGALMAELDRHDSVGFANTPGPLHRRLRSLSRAVHEAFALARSSPIASLNAFAESRTGRLVLLVFVALCSLAVLLRRSAQPLASPPPSAFVVRPRHPSSPHIPRPVPQGVSSGLDLGSPRPPPPPLQESVSPPRPRPRPPAPPPSPHRSPPPLSPTALLNARYLHGQSSNDTAAAGILIHQLDGIDLGDLRDDFGRLKKPWMPCPQTGMTWCSDIGDRLSASIINARLPHLFSDVAAGFIVNPRAEILCSFPKDGGTMPYKCTADERGREAGCVPGCYGPGRLRTRCDNLLKGCYDPEHVQNMLEDQVHVPPDRCDRCSQGNGCRYNEVRRPTVGRPAQKRLRKGTPPDAPVVCQSQIVLDAAAWVRDLPHTIQGVFFPRGGDVAKAREIHKQFVDHFGMRASDLPFLQLDVQNPTRPFETAILEDPGLPIPPAFSLTSKKCHALMSEPTSKFWTLWGSKAWEKLPNGEKGCWTAQGGADFFFDDVLGGDQCDANWYEGAKGNLGRPEMRPPFTAEAPALLGFDESIYAFCSTLVGQPPNFIKADGGLDFNAELAQRCVDANINILRIISSTRKPWTMCQNLRWVLCALTGKVRLPPSAHATPRACCARLLACSTHH